MPESPEIRRFIPNAIQPLCELPDAADLSEFLLSCPFASLSATCPSSIVCTKLVEYFNYRCAGRLEPLSAQFVTRAVTTLVRGGCSGIRANLKSIRRFGIPPILHCETCSELGYNQPDRIRFANANEYRSLHYLRLGNQAEAKYRIQSLKAWLASGFPVAFGFSVPSSLDYDGYIEYRPTFDSIQGGHAALLVGFDDKQLAASKGAFRVYCPWGNDWGDQGFGWLPYKFVERSIAVDFWTIIMPEWITAGELFRPV